MDVLNFQHSKMHSERYQFIKEPDIYERICVVCITDYTFVYI